MAMVVSAARQQRSAWQRGNSTAAAWRHRGMATAAVTTAVLPPRAAAVAMKTPAATAMVGAQTINNQLKTAMVTATEMVAMAATTVMMETKEKAVAGEARR